MYIPEDVKAVGERDLIALGMKPGPEIGIVLQEALEQALDDPSRNTREYMLAFAEKRTAGR